MQKEQTYACSLKVATIFIQVDGIAARHQPNYNLNALIKRYRFCLKS